jgi:hypothetical protein
VLAVSFQRLREFTALIRPLTQPARFTVTPLLRADTILGRLRQPLGEIFHGGGFIVEFPCQLAAIQADLVFSSRASLA